MEEEQTDQQSGEQTAVAPKSFPCNQCGADLKFSPGSASLACPYCGHENEIPQSEEDIEELDYHAFLNQLSDDAEGEESTVVPCQACGAEVTLQPNLASDECPFCGTTIVVTQSTRKVIKPKSLLPFKITRDQAAERFKNWINSLWFAPNKLKERARGDSDISGVYLPHWTYDANTTSFYRGERGDDYYVTEHYTERDANGNNVSKTRQVRKTRWHSVSGTVWNRFNDILVNASKSLPRKYVDQLEPWDLNNLVPYDDQYLSGFRSEVYQVQLDEGFGIARQVMDNHIEGDVRRDIGGDHQRVHGIRTSYNNLTFKHILLPVWISAYRYNQQTFRFMVNARTGEVQGERPWSWVKITLAVLAVLAVIAVIVAIAMNR